MTAAIVASAYRIVAMGMIVYRWHAIKSVAVFWSSQAKENSGRVVDMQ
jgi:hypothetical protein